MDISVTTLLQIIGQKEVELQVVRQELARVQAELSKLSPVTAQK